MSADPPTVSAEGPQTFTVSGSGFTPGLALFVLPCTIPGDPISPATPEAEIAARLAALNSGTDCDTGNLTPTAADGDGSFSVEATVNVEANLVWAAGDAAQTEAGAVPVFIVDADMGPAPMGAAETGFGGMAANDDGTSVALLLVAGLIGIVVLGGSAVALRRND